MSEHIDFSVTGTDNVVHSAERISEAFEKVDRSSKKLERGLGAGKGIVSAAENIKANSGLLQGLAQLKLVELGMKLSSKIIAPIGTIVGEYLTYNSRLVKLFGRKTMKDMIARDKTLVDLGKFSTITMKNLLTNTKMLINVSLFKRGIEFIRKTNLAQFKNGLLYGAALLRTAAVVGGAFTLLTVGAIALFDRRITNVFEKYTPIIEEKFKEVQTAFLDYLDVAKTHWQDTSVKVANTLNDSKIATFLGMASLAVTSPALFSAKLYDKLINGKDINVFGNLETKAVKVNQMEVAKLETPKEQFNYLRNIEEKLLTENNTYEYIKDTVIQIQKRLDAADKKIDEEIGNIILEQRFIKRY